MSVSDRILDVLLNNLQDLDLPAISREWLIDRRSNFNAVGPWECICDVVLLCLLAWCCTQT